MDEELYDEADVTDRRGHSFVPRQITDGWVTPERDLWASEEQAIAAMYATKKERDRNVLLIAVELDRVLGHDTMSIERRYFDKGRIDMARLLLAKIQEGNK